VAIKKISIDHQKDEALNHHQLRMLTREVYLLKKLSQLENNFYTIKLYDAIVNDEALESYKDLTDVYLVTSFENGTLD
jgi:serine/threonine protein kinase